MEEKHVSENRIVSIPGTYSIFGTKENTKPPEINALPLDSVIGDFRVIAVNEHPSAYMYTITSTIASGDWWTLYDNGLLDIYCDGDMPNYKIYYDDAGSYPPWYEEHPYFSIRSVRFADSVTSIGKAAFKYGTSFLSLTMIIPNSINRIGSHAFYNCKISNLDIPNGVDFIGEAAFRNSSLTSVTIPSSLTFLSNEVFMGCRLLNSVIIPEGISGIGYDTFNGSGLTSVTIPVSLERIGGSAFSNTPLKDVYYNGTKEQWGAINKGTYNSPLWNATIHYNSAGSA